MLVLRVPALGIVALVTLLAAAIAVPAHAETKQASLVLDANTGRVLSEQYADAPRKPASLTKMMTLYMAFSEIEAQRLSYSTKLRVSERAASVAPSKLGLDVGEEIELIDAIKALITKSANDMAVAIAEHIGGTEANFAKLMTARAKQIGMTSTRFMNASGLPDNRQISTARDMVTLGLRLQEDFPQHYRLFSIKSFDYKGKTYRTHNTLMLGFPGMDGIKTGYTRASGFNLVSSVRAEGKYVIAAVFGGTTAATRNAHMRMLLYRGLEAASTEKTRQSRPMLIAKAAPAKPAAKPQTVPKREARPVVETAWRADTVAVPSPRPVRMPETTNATAPATRAPAPAPVLRPVKDDIAAVLAEAEANAAPETVVATASAPLGAPLAPASVAPKLDLAALREAMSSGQPEPMQEPPTGIAALLAETAGAASDAAPETGVTPRAPSTLDAQAQRLGAQVAEAQPEPQPAKPTFAVASANAMALAHAPAAPAQATPSPAALDAAAPSMGGYEIQIGAFGSAVEAETKLSIARTRVPKLNDHEGILVPVQKGDRRIFRARFLRFDERGASTTCGELRRAAIDCFVMKSG